MDLQLRLTPKETERLRNVSYQRQLEAGMRNPGSAGLTVDRFGDADKWVPKDQEAPEMSKDQEAPEISKEAGPGA